MALAEIIKHGVGSAVDGVRLQISTQVSKAETRTGRPYYTFFVKDVESNEDSRIQVNIWNAKALPPGFGGSLRRGRLLQFTGCQLTEFNKKMQISITAGSISDGSIRLCEMKILPPLRKRKRPQVIAPREWQLEYEGEHKEKAREGRREMEGSIKNSSKEKPLPRYKVARTKWKRPEMKLRHPHEDKTFQLLGAEWLPRERYGVVYGLLPGTSPPMTCCVTVEEALSQDDFMLASNDWTTGAWVTIKSSALSLPVKKRSRCQVEFTVASCDDIQEHSVEALRVGSWPVRIFSFDIECISSRNSRYPNKLRDPIICISVVVQDIGLEPTRAILYFGQCENIVGAEVYCYRSEKDMLLGFRDFLFKADPDVITGYNVLNFDFPWIFARAEILGLHDYTDLGRAVNANVVIKPPEGIKLGEEIPYRFYNRINFPGRIVIDMLRMTREFLPERRARGYKLGDVASDMLQCGKDDVPYAYLKPLHHGSDLDRKRIAVYCIKDSELVIELMLHPRLDVIQKLLTKAMERGMNVQDLCCELGGLPSVKDNNIHI